VASCTTVGVVRRLARRRLRLDREHRALGRMHGYGSQISPTPNTYTNNWALPRGDPARGHAWLATIGIMAGLLISVLHYFGIMDL